MRYFIFLFIYLCTFNSIAQKLEGVVSLQNSQGQTVNGASITVSLVNKELQTISNHEGKFTIDLSNQVLGQLVSLEVKKSGLEVVSSEQLWLTSQQIKTAQTPIRIQMAPRGTHKERVEKFYAIAEQMVEKSAEDSLLKAKLSAKELNDLKNIAYDHLGLVVQRLAEFDTDQASEMAKQAFTAFENNNLSEALISMDDAKMAAALKNSSNGSVRGNTSITSTEKAENARIQSINNYLLKARLSILSLQVKAAQAYYTRALYEDQDDFVKIAEFTRLLTALHDDDKASSLCKKGFSVVRNDAQTLVILGLKGEILLRQNAQVDAAQTLEEAQKIYHSLSVDLPETYMPDVGRAFRKLGNLHQQNKNHSKALIAHQDAKKIYSNLILSLPDRYYEDIALCFKDIADSHKKLSHIEESTENYKQLVSWRKKAVDANKNGSYLAYVHSRHLLAQNYIYFGNVQDAMTLYEALVQDNKIIDNYEKGKSFLGLAKTQFLDLKTQTAIASSQQAIALLAGGYQQTLEKSNAYANALELQAACYRRQYHFDKAMEIYQKLGPVLGFMQQKAGNDVQEIIATSFDGMAQTYQGQSNFTRAEKFFQTALSTWEKLEQQTSGSFISNRGASINHLSQLYFTLGKIDQALTIIQQAIELYPEINQVHSFPLSSSMFMSYLTLAKLRLANGEIEEAASAMKKANALPTEGTAWEAKLAEGLIVQGKTALYASNMEDSRTLIQEAINKLTPLTVSKTVKYQLLLLDAYMLHAKVFIKSKQYTTAQARLEASEILLNNIAQKSAAKYEDQQLELNLSWADYYLERKEYGKAEEKLFTAIDLLEKGYTTEAVKYTQPLANTYYQLAMLYFHTKAQDECLAAFKKAEDLSKDEEISLQNGILANMYNNFANSMMEWAKYEEALNTLQKSAELYESMDRNSPEQYKEELAWVYADMAWCSIMLGQNGHAEAYADAATIHKEDDFKAQIILAHVQVLNNNFSGARKIYQNLANQTLDGKKISTICLEDLNAFEAAGIGHADFNKVRGLFK